MSIENGYADSDKAVIKNMYQSRGIQIVLTEGVYVRAHNNNAASALINQLASLEGGKYLTQEIGEIGQGFFFGTTGKLCGFIMSAMSLSNPYVTSLTKLQELNYNPQ